MYHQLRQPSVVGVLCESLSVYQKIQLKYVIKLDISIRRMNDLFEAGKSGDIGIVKVMIRRCVSHMTIGLHGACLGGHIEVVEFFLAHYDIRDCGIKCTCHIHPKMEPCEAYCALNYACQGRHREIVDILIRRGFRNWDCGLRGACQSGARELAELMIRNGATEWDWGLKSACKGGQQELATLMIKRGANLNIGIRNACETGQLKISELMIRYGATDVNIGLINACEKGHRKIAEFMIRSGATDWDWGLESACYGGHRELAELMLKHGATFKDRNKALNDACQRGHQDIVELLIEYGAKDLIYYRCNCGHRHK